MHARRAIIYGAALVVVAAAAGGLWNHGRSVRALQSPSIADLPVPPFPPRIAEGDTYDRCLSLLADTPRDALAAADAWQTRGGGDAATHCEALAHIATGKPDTGAEMLEALSARIDAPPLGRVALLRQAVQARLMANQPDNALRDASLALALTPGDTDLLIDHATASLALGQAPAAVQDLTLALSADADRGDALALRASAWRGLNRLDLAAADAERAVALDPDDAEALLERGIVRQRMGDRDGARSDWEHVRDIDPNSTAADLAAQNLALLEAGPDRR